MRDWVSNRSRHCPALCVRLPAAIGARARALATASAIASTTVSISAPLLYRPTPKRSARVDALVGQTDRAQHVRALAAGLGARRARRDRDRVRPARGSASPPRRARSRRAGCRAAAARARRSPRFPRCARAGRRADGRAARARARARRSSSAAPRQPAARAEADDARDVQRARAQAALLSAALRLRLSAGAADGARAGRRARPRPSVRTSCARTGSAGRRSRRRRRPGSGRAPARRRCGTRCPARGRARRSRPPAGSSRSRCWRPSRETSTVSGRSASAIRCDVHDAGRVDRHDRDREALALERPQRLQHRRVLDRGRDHVALRGGDQAPRIARLSDSVAPDVNTISSGVRADERRDLRRAPPRPRVAASWPNAWCVLDGLPKRSVKYGSIASSTAGSTGVVAWWSR